MTLFEQITDPRLIPPMLLLIYIVWRFYEEAHKS